MWSNRFDNNYQGGRWRLDFRMNGETFDKLVELLRPYLEKQDTNFRAAIPVEKRVGIGIWLSDGKLFSNHR